MEELLPETTRIEAEWRAVQVKMSTLVDCPTDIDSSTASESDQESSTEDGEETPELPSTCTKPSTSTMHQDELNLKDKLIRGTPTPSPEALELLTEIRNLPPPKLKLKFTKPSRISSKEVHAENMMRNRIPTTSHALSISKALGKTLRTTDN